ncbi:zinc metallopeptidase [Shouchella clausii]|uniref:Zn-dependent protease n=3 Tax=Shouchella TaxID=2893057 RepID=Q5WGQ8_SHOC1|nr:MULTISPECIES: zinc metallopeptidase [Shouchella]MCM3312687.1 zinc metallopeptidase [Psychrobacillus sp. MER TA 17]ALA50900.1 putative metal-dependent peptidase [Shouchella clausii]KKI85756.1 Zn-dependent protease [Shouchella clausii]MBU3231707.1 zinc metallopeptidase [Shouchella clausii]MBU3265009.1 zinc metallopeptidase [Shouchella clausii]
MSLGVYLFYLAFLILIPLLAQGKVKRAYKKYSRIRNSAGMTGAEVARKILHDNGIYDVEVEEVKGELSDHYDPRAKVVRLSTDNYRNASVAGAAIAAHEVGHAIQDAENYSFLKFRSALAPVASIGSNLGQWLILAGLLFGVGAQVGGNPVLLMGIIFFATAVLFQVVTLPVEFNASNRAMEQMVASGIIVNNEERETKKVLDAAALTYVAAALVALLELARFIMIYLAQRD